MKFLTQYAINFGRLIEGKHEFQFQLTKKFFAHFDYDEFNSCKITAKVKLIKKLNLLELEFCSYGMINLNCHVSNEAFDYVHNSNMDLVVKFGSDYNNDNDELLILPKGSHELNISQQLFEMIVLSLPIKIIHPGIIDGSLKSDTLSRLKIYESKFKDKAYKRDPRWDKLKDLK
ncbi:MAG: DUF177 domain-containing protein [Flavobacteriaceae bacterium]|nr:DUF177 domain-containing protein [Flavobacteriaceae bacterium]